jgi:hypothetical protein
VLEHILFYARLKGVPLDQEMAHSRQLLRSVGLCHLADTLAGHPGGPAVPG